MRHERVRFCVFATPVGHCGISWGAAGVTSTHLPAGPAKATAKEVAKYHPGAVESEPPGEVGAAIRDMVALLSGSGTDLSWVVLDMDGLPPFHQAVYEAARTIPPGHTATYGEVAAMAGAPGAARAVGTAMSKNPFPIVVPCHRVVAAGGKLGGFSAKGGVGTKQRLLEIEGSAEPPLLLAARPLQVEAWGSPGGT